MFDPDTAEFWTACRDHRLIVQQCASCDAFRFAPAPRCYRCRSGAHRWVESEGVGEVYTWTVVHRAANPALEPVVPYNVVVVRLDDSQSWEFLADADPLLAVGNKVTIRRALLGSFVMTTPSGRENRVKRLSAQ